MAADMSAMISIQNLTKRFGPILAVDDVSFTVGRGEVLGFLGPNGAGKSTTMKMITGFLTPTGGTAVVCGHDVIDEPVAVKKKVGYLPEGAPAYPDMTPAAFLDFCASVRGLGGAEKRAKIDAAVDRVQLREVLQQSIDTLSKGFKRRVGLAQAMLHDPKVLILDEPTDGLDPNQKHEVRSLIEEMAPEKAIIISTHILEEVEAVCTRAVIIARGRVVADGTPAMLQSRSRWHNAVSLTLADGEANSVAAALKGLPFVVDVEQNPEDERRTCVTAFPRGGTAIVAEINQFVRERNIPAIELRLERGRLDDVFRAITTENA